MKIRRFVDEALTDYPTMDGDTPIDTTGKPEKILDFNLVLPMPEELRNTSAPLQTVATQEEADEINRKHAESWKRIGGVGEIKAVTIETFVRWQNEYGATDWYDWAVRNWGTKWGAYSHSHYELRFLKEYGEDGKVYGRVDLRFETAWSQPTPIFEKIEERWGVTVHAVTQDEGGFPDVEYGDPYGADVLRKIVTHEFESWHDEVDEPEIIVIAEVTE